MLLSKTELEILRQISLGSRNLKEIAAALKKSKSQIYRDGKKLVLKDLVEFSDGNFKSTKNTPSALLMQLLADFSSLIIPLSDSGLDVLVCLLEPHTVEKIMIFTGLGRTQVSKKIKQARAISLVKKIDNKYVLNKDTWPLAAKFFAELKTYDLLIDSRIPENSKIYFKNKSELLFSNSEKIDATLTAFSVYEKYGIKILLQRNYYCLPKRNLTIETVFVHSLKIVEFEKSIQHIIVIALFYAKYREKLQDIDNEIRKNIDKIFEGEQISGYPGLGEIQERADVYDIKI